jgi:hypothetical protein
MLSIFRYERNQGGWSGVGDKLAVVWSELRKCVLSFVNVDDELEKHELAEPPELGEYNAFDDGRVSITSLSTPHCRRPTRRCADEAPESPLPTVRAEFD